MAKSVEAGEDKTAGDSGRPTHSIEPDKARRDQQSSPKHEVDAPGERVDDETDGPSKQTRRQD